MTGRLSLATSPTYLDHAIAALQVATLAQPIEYMEKFPCPKPPELLGDKTKPDPQPGKPIQLSLFDAPTPDRPRRTP